MTNTRKCTLYKQIKRGQLDDSLKIVEKEFDKCNSLFSYVYIWEWRKSLIK